MTWDECFDQGMDKRQAAIVMGCDRKTAYIRLGEIADMRADTRRFDRDVRRLATAEARPKTERSFYPTDLLEFNARITDRARNVVYGEVTDRQRAIVAAGIPFAEITPSYGSPEHPKETLSRAQFDLDAPERYRKIWAEIEALNSAPTV